MRTSRRLLCVFSPFTALNAFQPFSFSFFLLLLFRRHCFFDAYNPWRNRFTNMRDEKNVYTRRNPKSIRLDHKTASYKRNVMNASEHNFCFSRNIILVFLVFILHKPSTNNKHENLYTNLRFDGSRSLSLCLLKKLVAKLSCFKQWNNERKENYRINVV